jgi:UMF1 family MFS transporter
MKKNDKTLINAWSMYDWANSVYALVITSTIFPIYYAETTATSGSDKVMFLGLEFVNTSLYSYALSFSFILIALFSPMLSSIADYAGKKKSFMQFFCYMGALACISLFFFTGTDTLGIGISAFIVASIGFSGSIIFYNAYLPEIATPDQQDNVSARGFSLGYIGSVILLLFNLSMIMYPDWYGIVDDQLPARISFLTVGIWWICFAQMSFYY